MNPGIFMKIQNPCSNVILLLMAAFGLAWLPRADGEGTLAGDQYVTGNLSVGLSNVQGPFSIPIGYNTSASGNNSVAAGYNSIANGLNSITLGGLSASVTGNNSVGVGSWSNVTSDYVVSINSNPATINPGNHSLEIGSANACGNYSITIGNVSASSPGGYVIALGANASAAANYSVALGNANGNTTTNGNYSVAIGGGVVAQAPNTVAVGTQVTAGVYGSMIVGKNNYSRSGQSATAWVSSDDLFAVGDGASSAANHTAFLIEKNGNVGVGNFSSAPSEALEVQGEMVLDNTTLATTSADGTLAWNGTDLYLHFAGNWMSLTIKTPPVISLAANGTATAPTLNFGSGNTTGVFSPAPNILSLATNSTERLRIDGSGNVGLGTGNSSLSSTLTANGTVSFNNTSGNTTFLAIASNGNLTISTNTTFTGNTTVSFGNQTTLSFGQAYSDISMGGFP